MPSMIYPPGYGQQQAAPQTFAPQPAFSPQHAPAVQPQASAWQPTPRDASPRPIIRGKGPDEPPTPALVKLTMPTPADLGIMQTTAGDLDWADAHRRINALGAVCFNLEKLPQGGYRMVCILPGDQPNRQHRVEAQANTEAEAIQLVLGKSEAWAGGR